MKTISSFFFLFFLAFHSGIAADSEGLKYIPGNTAFYMRIDKPASLGELSGAIGQKIGQPALQQSMPQFLENLLSAAPAFKNVNSWSSQGVDRNGSIILWGKPPTPPAISLRVNDADQIKKILMETQAYSQKNHGTTTYYASDSSAWTILDNRLIYANESELIRCLDAYSGGASLVENIGFNRVMKNAANKHVVTYWNMDLFRPLITASLNQLPPPVFTHPAVLLFREYLLQVKSMGVMADISLEGMQINMVMDIKDNFDLNSLVKSMPQLGTWIDYVPENAGLAAAIILDPTTLKAFVEQSVTSFHNEVTPQNRNQIAVAIDELARFAGQTGAISINFPNSALPSLSFVCQVKDKAGADQFFGKYFSGKEPVEILLRALSVPGSTDGLVTAAPPKKETYEGIEIRQVPFGFRLPAVLQQLQYARPELSVVRDEKVEQSKTTRKIVDSGWKGSWSPDGKQIVYGKPDSQGLCIVNIATGKSQEINSQGKDPVWSPDGRNIAFAFAPSGTDDYQAEEVYVMPSSGGASRKIAQGGFPGWSGNGKTLYYHSRIEGKIFAVKIDDADAKPEMFFERPASWYPAVSPDGTKIAAGNNGTLTIVERATSKVLAQWTAPGLRGVLPSWSWDGKQVAFGGFNDDPGGVWVYDLENSKSYNVIKGAYTMPAWSKDGKMAFDFRSGNVRELWINELNSGELEQEVAGSLAKIYYAFYAGKLAISLGANSSGLKTTLDCLRGAKPSFAKVSGYAWMNQQQLSSSAVSVWVCPISLLQWENSLRKTIPDEILSGFKPGIAASVSFGCADGAIVQRLCVSWDELRRISNLAKNAAQATAPSRDTFSEFQRMREAGQWDAMYQLAEDEIQAVPNSAQNVVNNLLNMAQQGNHTKHLMKHFENRLNTNSKNVIALGILGQANLNNGAPKKAVGYFEKAVQLAPDNVSLLMANAQANRQFGNDDKAIALYKKVIEMDPVRSNAYVELASIYASIGKKDQVFALAEKASPHLKNASHLLIALGDIYMQGQFYSNAIPVYQRAIDKDPHLYWYQDKLAIAYEMSGQVDKAEAIYDSMTDANYIMQRFYRISSQGDLAKIRKLALRIIESPKSQYWQVNNAFYQLIEAFARQNRAGELEPLVKKYYQEKPADIQRVYQLGRLYQRVRNHTKTATLYEQALEIFPKDPGLMTSLSNAYRELGRIDEAIKMLKRSIELFPQEGNFYTLLAAIHAKNRQTNEIAQLGKAFDRQLKTNPDNPEAATALSHLGKLYFMAGQYDTALANLSKIMENQELNDVEVLDYWVKTHIQVGKSKELDALALKSENSEFILKVICEYSQSEKLSQDRLEALWRIVLHLWECANQSYHKFQGFNYVKEAYGKHNCSQILESKILQEIEKKPNDAFMYGLKGLMHQDQKQYGKSVEAYEKAVELSANSHEYRHNLVEAYINNKQFEKAIALIRLMLNRSPDQIDLYPLLANAYAELGQKSEVNQTLAELKQALNQTRIHHAMGFRNMALADTYMAAEQFDEAIDSYKKVMEFEPMSEQVCKEKLIKAYTKAGKTNLAEELRKTLDIKSKD